MAHVRQHYEGTTAAWGRRQGWRIVAGLHPNAPQHGLTATATTTTLNLPPCVACPHATQQNSKQDSRTVAAGARVSLVCDNHEWAGVVAPQPCQQLLVTWHKTLPVRQSHNKAMR